MKSQDIVILLKLISLENRMKTDFDYPSSGNPFAVRNLGDELGISKTEVSASFGRSMSNGLAAKIDGRVTPNRRNLCEFIIHGLKYVFPAEIGAPQRGMPTGFAAPMLQGRIISAGSEFHVWPWAEGEKRGTSIEPLFKSVPNAAEIDEQLYRYLALIDAIRMGRKREENLAKDLIEQDMLQ